MKCSACKEEKDESEFRKKKNGSFNKTCNECIEYRTKYNKHYYYRDNYNGGINAFKLEQFIERHNNKKPRKKSDNGQWMIDEMERLASE